MTEGMSLPQPLNPPPSKGPHILFGDFFAQSKWMVKMFSQYGMATRKKGLSEGVQKCDCHPPPNCFMFSYENKKRMEKKCHRSVDRSTGM